MQVSNEIDNIIEKTDQIQEKLSEILQKQNNMRESLCKLHQNMQSMPPPEEIPSGSRVVNKPIKKQVKRLGASQTIMKYNLLIDTPIGNKSVDVIPGIGRATVLNLKTQNISKAIQFMGKYLMLNRNDEEFKKWLKELNIRPQYIEQIMNTLDAKCEKI